MYKGAILAPMVRIGTLPTRLLCLEEGADLVYTEEIIDHRLMDCRKFEHENGLVEFKITAEDNPVLQTCPTEKEKVILQLGTADPDRAVKAAKLCQDHISGVDVNMGCPKAYSTKGGMGAAMLKTPDLAESILKALVSELNIPVTCKIRCLKSVEETVEFAKRMEKTGIAALAIHGRQKTERSRDPCRSPWIAEVAKSLKIPVLANGGSGEIKSRADIDEFQKKTGTAGVLVARAAMWNPSVFNKAGPRHVFEVVKRYCELCLEYDFALEVMKYNVLSMLRDLQDKDPRGLATKPALSSKEIAECWGVVQEDEDGPNPKKKKLDCETENGEESYPYVHNHFKKLKLWEMDLNSLTRNKSTRLIIHEPAKMHLGDILPQELQRISEAAVHTREKSKRRDVLGDVYNEYKRESENIRGKLSEKQATGRAKRKSTNST